MLCSKDKGKIPGRQGRMLIAGTWLLQQSPALAGIIRYLTGINLNFSTSPNPKTETVSSQYSLRFQNPKAKSYRVLLLTECTRAGREGGRCRLVARRVQSDDVERIEDASIAIHHRAVITQQADEAYPLKYT
jgi:hypothetical protein